MAGHYPCSDCCADCEYFSDSFDRSDDTDLGADWTETAGAWEIASNKLSTASSDGICICGTDGVLSYVVRSSLLGGAVNDEWRVIFNYTDSNNYSYARVEFVFALTVQVKLVSVLSGVHTVEDTSSSFTHDIDVTPLSVQVCVHAGTANVSTGQGSGFAAMTARAAAAMATTSGTCGVGTGTNGATAVTFDNFSIQKHRTTQSGCPDCPFECSHCIDDIASDAYQIVITGVVNAVGDTNCSEYNGTWIVSPVDQCSYATGNLTFSSAPRNCSIYADVELNFDNAETLFGCNDGASDVHAIRVWLFWGTSTTCS